MLAGCADKQGADMPSQVRPMLTPLLRDAIHHERGLIVPQFQTLRPSQNVTAGLIGGELQTLKPLAEGLHVSIGLRWLDLHCCKSALDPLQLAVKGPLKT